MLANQLEKRSTMTITEIGGLIAVLAWITYATLDDMVLGTVVQPPDMTIALWSFAPGMIGGFAMQLLPDKAKRSRQFAGEVLCSGLAGFVIGAFAAEYVKSGLILMAVACIAGASGAKLLEKLITPLEKFAGEMVSKSLGSDSCELPDSKKGKGKQ